MPFFISICYKNLSPFHISLLIANPECTYCPASWAFEFCSASDITNRCSYFKVYSK